MAVLGRRMSCFHQGFTPTTEREEGAVGRSFEGRVRPGVRFLS